MNTNQPTQRSRRFVGGTSSRGTLDRSLFARGSAAAIASIAALAATALFSQAATQFYPGVVQVDQYNGVGGGSIGGLTGAAKYPNSPDIVYFPSAAESRCNTADGYGIRMQGLYIAAESGDHVFYISGDDNCQLFLSTDENPANAVLVAREPEWNGCRDWIQGNTCCGRDATGGRPLSANVDPNQPSPTITVPINLTAGNKYYFRFLLSEGGGGDGGGVTVKGPSDPDVANGAASIITGDRVGVNAESGPRILSGPTSAAAVYSEGSPVNFNIAYYVPPGATPSYQWTRNGSDIPGATEANYSFPATAADDNTRYAVKYTIGASTITSSEVTINVRGLVDSVGFVKFERFNGIGGTAVANLTGAQKYIDNTPDSIEYRAGFEAPVNVANDFGGRLTAWFIPPADGNYIFNVSADDGAELWLSTDETPDNLAVIAREPTWAGSREWRTAQGGGVAAPSGKISDPIPLVKGARYFIQGLYKEGGGGDNFAATYYLEGEDQPANGTPPKLVGTRILTQLPDPQSTITISAQPQSVVVVQDRSTVLTVSASATSPGGALPVGYQWTVNGDEIDGATGNSLALRNVTSAQSGNVYAVKVFTLGSSKVSDNAVLTVVPDTFPPKLDSVGGMRRFVSNEETRVEVSVSFDEPVTEASATTLGNYSLSKGSVTGAQFVANSSGKDLNYQGVLLTVTGLNPGDSATLTVNGVADPLGNTMTVAASKAFTVSRMSWASIGRYGETANDGFKDFIPAALNIKGDTDFNLVSGGQAFWDVNDDITVVYEEITGDFDKVAQIEFHDISSNWARAGLGARESLNNGAQTTGAGGDNPASRYQAVHAPNGMKFDGTASNNAFESNRRLATGGATSASGAAGRPGDLYPNAWVRLKRVGTRISIYFSELGNRQNFRPLGTTVFGDVVTGENLLADTLYVGPTFGPENGNIGTAELRGLFATRIRNYSDHVSSQKPRGSQSLSIGLALARNEGGAVMSAHEVAGLGSVAQANWNQLFGQNTPAEGAVAVVADRNGASEPTTATVEWTSNNTWASTGRGEENNKFVGADLDLMTGYLDTGNATTSTVTVRDIPAELAAGYDVVVYFLGGIGAGRAGAVRLVDGEGNQLTDYVRLACNDNATSYVEAIAEPGNTTHAVGNYYVFKGRTETSFVLEATTAGGHGAGGAPRMPVNAVQIVKSGGAPAPTVSIKSLANGSVEVTFTGTLQAADNVEGPYNDVVGATSPRVIAGPTAKKFYRSRN